jgi:hypothetical protein
MSDCAHCEDARGEGYREALRDAARVLAENGLVDWSQKLQYGARVHRESGVDLLEQPAWR